LNNNNNNEGQIGIEKIEDIIERLYQKMIQIQNINFFHTDFPDTIDFKGVHPVANWGKAFLFIFAIPLTYSPRLKAGDSGFKRGCQL